MTNSKMLQTRDLGTDWWNDDCDFNHLKEAVKKGACGATSNPFIVYEVVTANAKTLTPVLDELIKGHSTKNEDELTWLLIEDIGIKASKILLDVYHKHQGQKGYLSMQVNPKFYNNTDKMVEHALHLSSLAPNIAIKVPATLEGIEAVQRLTAKGVTVNATVSFTVSQAMAAAQAIQAGLEEAQKNNVDTNKMSPYVTIMVGRVDDQMGRCVKREKVLIDPGYLHQAGIAVFKKAYEIFKQKGFKARLLSAAYRHHMHWQRLQGKGVIQTIPYAFWKSFDESAFEVKETINDKVDERIVDELFSKVSDFRLAYQEDALQGDQFKRYGASVHTLNQFLTGYEKLVQFVRERMLEV